MFPVTPTIGASQEEEWQELQAVLLSGILDKAPNLSHFLEYVSEQYFSGNSDQVKEYNIAVHALHRPEHFDPQVDSIVRVTAHTLRKKLEQYYASEGANHLLQIRLPAGKYVLQFERQAQVSLPRTRGHASVIRIGVVVAGAAVLLFLGNLYLRQRQSGKPMSSEKILPAAVGRNGPGLANPPGPALSQAMRVRFGAASHPYVDVAGQTWSQEQFCKGGTTFAHPDHEIQGTDDPALFQEGLEGKFQCRIPAPPGTYQLLLLFADTAGDKEAARQVVLSINNAATAALDIVDEAGGDDVVVGKVYAGIRPMGDGAIHLDFISDGSFINAAELTPSNSDAGTPLRMLAGPAVFRDDQGNTWLPERFFQGGRRTFHPDNLPKVANSRLFEWERYGHFHYFIPVVAGKEYRVRLYFSEGWFGKSNGSPEGVGSRVFDVYCNGTSLLRNFDILQNQGNNAVVITTYHVRPTAHGVLELYFTPVKNYPLINAIEVEAEGSGQ
jgi:hypothetical protein